MADLNGQQFFHGSRHDIEDVVLPGRQVGRANYDYDLLGHDRHDWAFVSDNENTAWEWAHTGDLKGGRARVYRVQPEEPKTPAQRSLRGPSLPHEYTTSKAPVVQQIDIPKPPETRKVRRLDDDRVRYVEEPHPGIQGTLPPVNWHQFGGFNFQDYDQVAGLHAGLQTYKGDIDRIQEKAARRQSEEGLRIMTPKLFE